MKDPNNKNELIPAAAYARYSSDKQNPSTIDAQLAAIQEYAQRNGYVIVRIYKDEAKSGTTDVGRDDFLRMIDDSANGDFKAVIVYMVDRFSRNAEIAEKRRKELLDNDVELLSTTEDISSSSHPIVRLLHEGMAENYSRQLGIRVMGGHIVKAEKSLHNGGIPPLGYDVDCEDKLVINPTEREAVKLIFDRLLEGHSYHKIADELNLLGYRTKQGNEFTVNSFHDLIQNEKYCGDYVYNKTSKRKSNGSRNAHKEKKESEIIRNTDAIPAIVTREQFEQVKKIVKARKDRRGEFKAKRTYLLSGLIKCGCCGELMESNTSENSRGYLSSAYRCSHRKNNCKNPQINQKVIENYVLMLLERLIFNESSIPKILKGVQDYFTVKNGREADEYRKLSNRIKANEKEIDRLIDAVAKGENVDLYNSAISKRVDENAKMTQSKQRLSVYTQTINVTEDMLRRIIGSFAERVRTRDKEDCKRFIRDFVDSVIIYQDKVEVNLKISNLAEGFTLTQSINRQFLPKVKATKESK